MNIETFDYKTESWVEEAICQRMRRKNARCFNCGRIGHLRRHCRQGIPRNNVSYGNDKNKRYQLSGLCRRCGKGRHWTNECRSTKHKQGNLIPLENSLQGAVAGHKVKSGSVIPSHCGGHVSPQKF